MYIQSYTFFRKVIAFVNIFLHNYSFYLLKNAQFEIFCVILHRVPSSTTMADKETKNINQWQPREHVNMNDNEEINIALDGDEGIFSFS